MTSGDLTPVIRVIYWASSTVPSLVADEGTWPFTTESFDKIERWTGIPAAEARAILETKGEVRASMWYFRLAFEEHRADGSVVLLTGCGCPVCIAVFDDGGLQEGHIDCCDYPRSRGVGRCSDPFRILCVCLGTAVAGGPCEACGAYTGSAELVRIVAGLEREVAS